MTYTFSFYTKERTPVVEGKVWWKFWTKQKIGWTEQWIRKSFTVDEHEASILMESPHEIGYISLIHKLLGESKDWQLTRGTIGTAYVSTSSSGIPNIEQVAITNMVLYSEEKP